jgi:hypothetical protein
LKKELAKAHEELAAEKVKNAVLTAYGFCRKLSQQAKPMLDKIEEHILNQNTVYTDATHVTVDGKQAYVRNMSCSDAVRYFGMPKKNLDELKNINILMRFAGILVHDHETTLYHFGTGHGECNVHLIRYLLKNSEDCSTKWSGELTELLYRMKRRCEELSTGCGKTELPEDEFGSFMTNTMRS